MKHTWTIVDETGERVEVSLMCRFDEIIDTPLRTQYLIDLLGNAAETARSVVSF